MRKTFCCDQLLLYVAEKAVTKKTQRGSGTTRLCAGPAVNGLCAVCAHAEEVSGHRRLLKAVLLSKFRRIEVLTESGGDRLEFDSSRLFVDEERIAMKLPARWRRAHPTRVGLAE